MEFIAKPLYHLLDYEVARVTKLLDEQDLKPEGVLNIEYTTRAKGIPLEEFRRQMDSSIFVIPCSAVRYS